MDSGKYLITTWVMPSKALALGQFKMARILSRSTPTARPLSADECKSSSGRLFVATSEEIILTRGSYFQPSGVGMDLTQKPRVSSDLALNAFAQLAALKLNCQRSFISLMDHENQYIIAEVCLVI
jgi:hypothetical protein